MRHYRTNRQNLQLHNGSLQCQHQLTATHCNTLQHTATHYKTPTISTLSDRHCKKYMAAKLLEVGLCSNESNINHNVVSRCMIKCCDACVAIYIEEIHSRKTLTISTLQDRHCNKYLAAKLREVGVCNAIPRYIHKYCNACVAIYVLNQKRHTLQHIHRNARHTLQHIHYDTIHANHCDISDLTCAAGPFCQHMDFSDQTTCKKTCN